ncbi:MAG: radical SAM protein [Thermodesulfovibrionales bacterium]|jgi:MoaA/NifB/PqqE/SkfB family radical SAM enzyme
MSVPGIKLLKPLVSTLVNPRRGLPGQLIMQYTDRCNARCPQCGMRVTNRFRRSTLGLDLAKRVIEDAAERGVKAISFTGGEPLLYLHDIATLVSHARKMGIEYTRTGTNGYLFAHSDSPRFEESVARVADKLAESGLYTFWISLDSADASLHEEMRGLPGVVKGIEKALPIFESRGIYPSVNLGINRNLGRQRSPEVFEPLSFYEFFRDALRTYYRSVCDMGFTIANACYPMSMDEGVAESAIVYAAASADNIVRFTRAEKELIFKALFDTIPEFRPKLRIFTPRSSLYALGRQMAGDEEFSFPCRGGLDFFFVSAKDGAAYPCGYRGDENLGSFRDLPRKHLSKVASCRRCEWECFRDPSEMMGPVVAFFSDPVAFYRKIARNGAYRRLWIEDLRYYAACDFFDARRPPEYERLSRFSLLKSFSVWESDPRHSGEAI